MLHFIEFKDKRFDRSHDYNLIEFTENTIILCNNYQLLDTFANEIIKTVNRQAEYNDYFCEDKDIGMAKVDLVFALQRVIDINGQKITLGLEPSIIYKADKPEDIWFFDWSGSDKNKLLPPYKEFIYPMLIFKGSREVWKKGKNYLYDTICSGLYGCYDGDWIKDNML